jgi:alkanesulfonate monooxygenase SsuD/methylene tetrahydromethanopterin reductase-like flavin-dependent oxidoreductase (luciferase family)
MVNARTKPGASRSTSGLHCELNESTIMPRYFFHLHQTGVFLKDDEGQLLRDADEAWEAARATAHALMAGDPDRTAEWLASRFEVTDQDGTILLEFTFREAVELRNEPN